LTYPAIIFWCLAVWALWSRGPTIYYLFFGSWSFAMVSLLPTGNDSFALTPGWVCAALIIVRAFNLAGPSASIRILVHPKCFLPLIASAAYGTVTALLMPYIFYKSIPVFAVRLATVSKTPSLLTPTNANITQSLYYVISVGLVWASYIICTIPDQRRHFFKALLFGAVVALATGIIDSVAGAAHLNALLAPFRTASYALVDGAEMMGVRRIIGLTPEASAYAALVYGFAVIIAMVPVPSRYFAPLGPWRLLLSAALIGMTLASTSSSGVVSIMGLGTVIAAWATIGAISGRPSAMGILFVGVILATTLLGAVLFLPETSSFFGRLFETLVLKKNLSDSYIERSTWNQVSFDAFFRSFGLGIGLGSARASSYVPMALSNLGLPGVLCLLFFFGQMILAKPADPADRDLATTLKLAVPAGLLPLVLAGATPNFGLANAVMYGALIAVIWPNLGSLSRVVSTPHRRAVSPKQTAVVN
jgi:hypothetical protein